MKGLNKTLDEYIKEHRKKVPSIINNTHIINEKYKEYICPYCGSIDYIKNYHIKYKDGRINKKMVRCRICENKMKTETLKANMSPFEWGLWLSVNVQMFRSPHNRFVEKIRYKLIFENLDIMGKYIKREFKDGYYYIRNKEITNVDEILSKLNYKFGIWKKSKPLTTLDNFSS